MKYIYFDVLPNITIACILEYNFNCSVLFDI